MSDEKTLKKFNEIKSYAFKDFRMFGYSDVSLDKEFLCWNIKDGNVNHLKDSIWFFFNRLISEFPRNFQTQAQIYWSMAVFDYKYGNGKVVDMMKELSADARVNHFRSVHAKDRIITVDVVVVCGNRCEACMEDKDKRYDLIEIFKSHPLPHKNCTCAGIGCTCMLSLSPRKDEHGLFILDI